MEIKDLPTIEELYQRYKSFNEQYFDNKLPKKVTIEWSNRLTTAAGNCSPQQKLIRLSTWYHLKLPNEVDNTLIHEMIHLVVPNHGSKFNKYLKDLQAKGVQVNRYATEKAKEPRWLYTCANCDNSFKSYRRYLNRYICRACKSKFIESPL